MSCGLGSTGYRSAKPLDLVRESNLPPAPEGPGVGSIALEALQLLLFWQR